MRRAANPVKKAKSTFGLKFSIRLAINRGADFKTRQTTNPVKKAKSDFGPKSSIFLSINCGGVELWTRSIVLVKGYYW